MIISLNQQLKLLIYSFLAGALTGILFDLYRVVRGFGNKHEFFTIVEDTLFFIFSAIVIFIFLLYTNYAYTGFYVYMWLIIGIYIYFKIISRLFLKILYNSVRGIRKAFRLLFNFLVYPLQLFIYFLHKKIKN